MDIFQLRQQIIDQYAAYTRSFLTIADPAIRTYVDQALAEGRLWPDALVQLSPAYDQAGTIAELVAHKVLHPLCGEIFRAEHQGELHPIRLYRHQRQAIDLAAERKHYVVTTGTGSGKSLTYIVPIVDYILKHRPGQKKVRAIIVYPMNALINSQDKAIERFFANVPGGCPISWERYTGQESDTDKRRIQADPPDILLTNYVMLELMLTRPDEFTFVNQGSADLQFIVLDELHTYRGRQGADVALLIRRLRERSGNPNLTCIGTSATMVSGETIQDRRAAVAAVASTIFGVTVEPDHVIEETLTYATQKHAAYTPETLRAAVEQELPAHLEWEGFRAHPLAHWIEQTFSLRPDGGRLRRADPRTLARGAAALAHDTGLDEDTCVRQLRRFFELGRNVKSPDKKPGFTFKLHQFFSQGSAVYTTLEPSPARHLTLEGQRFVAGPGGDRLLFPLVFCRECGQHYALCAYDQQAHAVTPRHPLSRGEDVDEPAVPGYLLADGEAWSEELEERLPDSWFNLSRKGRTLKREFEPYKPKRLEVLPDGQVLHEADPGSNSAWFIPTPFLTCLRCGAVYTRRERDDFRKLARLSSEGRSTATTLLSIAAIDEMRRSKLDAEAQKLLSFTDNRQDASLQAGHFNDFANVALLRAAIAAALRQRQSDDPLTHLSVARAVLEALDLPQAAFARNPTTRPGPRRANEDALASYLEYRIYEDLRRSWRITQPNLEQCGLLRVDYRYLDDLCQDEEPWAGNEVLAACTPAQRTWAIRAMLDHMRRDLAIDAPCLDPDRQSELVKTAAAALKQPWTFADEETRDLRPASRFVVPSDDPVSGPVRSFSIRGQLGRFLRSPKAWPVLEAPLDGSAYERLLNTLLDALVAELILVEVGDDGPRAVQIRRDALLWRVGDDAPPPLDPVRSRRMDGRETVDRQANAFFRDFYRQPPASLRGIEGREHTGQVPQKEREDREDRFGKGELPVLFCSPTMELGIDIRDLNVVHMRNVPPTPANYAQRSGRAGRSGQPALVMTYCSTGSGHDQYFFQRQSAMVAGAVAAPQIDLANEDLIRAHVHAIWLAATGLDFERSMLHLIDTSVADMPLNQQVQTRLTLDEEQQAACVAQCRRVLAGLAADLGTTGWYSEQWLSEIIASVPGAFARACNRWRELYTAADEQLQAARRAIDAFHHGTTDRKAREEGERREDEAKRQKDLLCNASTRSGGEGDFYPYRYFASEGFLPGYNFPRLPIRAMLQVERDAVDFLARPRFLALTEFGPQNVVYHEGRKYRMTQSIVPASDMQRRLLRAKICRVCGYFHEGLDAQVCEQCGNQLSGQGAQPLLDLFEMTTMSARRVERITCEEEERLREGFRTTTHYQFARVAGVPRREDAETSGADAPALLLSYGPTATLWRINHGWRQSKQPGFALDLRHGRWGGRPDGGDLGDADPLDGESVKQGVRILVRDTRNLLVVLPEPAISDDLELVTSLQYALQRGIAAVFQLEDQEISSEILGEGSSRRIVYWEAAEGGAGALRRLVKEPDALARVARAALEICHVDPVTGDERAEQAGECARACYRCLLSYGNQQYHALLNRRTLQPLLMGLAQAGVVQTGSPPIPQGAPVGALGDVPPAVQRVLTYLKTQGGHLPNAVLRELAGFQPHLTYFDAYICLLCPEPGEDTAAMKVGLEAAGYTVYLIDPTQDVGPQLGQYRFWRP